MNIPFRLGADGDPVRLALPSPDHESAGPRVRGSMRLALVSIGLFVLVFAIWSWAAPLNSAAIASGFLEAEGGGRRTVQHLEGGIVRQFLVKEGQAVRAGEPLVLFDATKNDASDAALRSSFYGLLAQDARLTAERLGLPTVNYPAELLAAGSDPEVREIIAASNAEFASRRRGLSEQAQILSQRIGQSNADIRSSGAQIAALSDQAKLLDDEQMGVDMLVDEGLERRSRLLALQRQKALVDGERGKLTNNLDRLRDTIGETRAQMVSLRGQMVLEATGQQREVRLLIAEAREKLKVSDDIRTRQQVIAPVAGRVANLRLITPGGVIGAGQPILDIVPTSEKIVVSARLRPIDIDMVHRGLKAEIKLTPYKARVIPNLLGTVKEVSPDAIYDKDAQQIYYKVIVEISAAQLKKYPDVQLMSGMPAEVYIDLGSSSLLQYLFQPMIDSFNRSFREG
ncbi:HlyD family type I secretion periplasmic adaptor subunit [Sphingopyxis sp.]|uniref:HlyD family type I secretion periplasmic adaptor subunit n=1 Tax=Sphingopyxis sp. TaxID=1908224 RepID=UPI001DF9D186|nr:HlyD family type I secretion periplasmic adaptor subunit [Sphingopyxis sp.]MBW8296485.1 HlyD family type I secretion periplasmic adaptor subunit [Sphingopyxis sp.]